MGSRRLTLEGARVRVGLTQLDLALQTGLSASRAGELEALRRRLTAAELARAAAVLGVDAEELAQDILREETGPRPGEQEPRP